MQGSGWHDPLLDLCPHLWLDAVNVLIPQLRDRLQQPVEQEIAEKVDECIDRRNVARPAIVGDRDKVAALLFSS